MKIYLVLAATIVLFSLPCIAQDGLNDKDKQAEYNKTIDTRAQKIVATLGITQAPKATLVKNMIVSQYKNLNTIYLLRDQQIKAVKENQVSSNKDSVNACINKIKEEATAQISILHKKYIAQLSGKLTPTQVDQVKDGMTYNVLHVTYNGYNQMIRTLTVEQQKQIMTWLIEARELAMDAESSEKKHGVFGKYKGRINNYLSAAGYDLRKEGDDWQVRIKEAAEKKKSGE
ncbi:MAG: DUF3826 domain-containing protein [Ferruginibacter sp.]